MYRKEKIKTLIVEPLTEEILDESFDQISTSDSLKQLSKFETEALECLLVKYDQEPDKRDKIIEALNSGFNNTASDFIVSKILEIDPDTDNNSIEHQQNLEILQNLSEISVTNAIIKAIYHNHYKFENNNRANDLIDLLTDRSFLTVSLLIDFIYNNSKYLDLLIIDKFTMIFHSVGSLSVRSLLHSLDDYDWSERCLEYIKGIIVDFGDESVIPLLTYMKTCSYENKLIAAEIMDMIGHVSAMRIVEALNDTEPTMKLPHFHKLQDLKSHELEKVVYNLYEAMYYHVDFTEYQDQGGDIIATKLGKERIIIQVKSHKNNKDGNRISNFAVQQVKTAQNVYFATKCVVVANNYFSPAAVELARANNVELIDIDSLQALVDNYL
ncbi:restriction endonuclease [Methanohalobium evestigatum Z-7303]|uniref:Restriction endonuclease n=1 Tax=Methanohalobium evestigatum (strain ATCC BAA-1072 / DSM 3721 / NBRC 107634 / OCM 161 / Z-7303) TaxID=644295 RepID=D7E666_METEZ|nr:restriction endonuclease [Methanohalobium evestigatum]ADI73088.1 restriction endonuclease [Methanohalobium evestigatum Z-7303]